MISPDRRWGKNDFDVIYIGTPQKYFVNTHSNQCHDLCPLKIRKLVIGYLLIPLPLFRN